MTSLILGVSIASLVYLKRRGKPHPKGCLCFKTFYKRLNFSSFSSFLTACNTFFPKASSTFVIVDVDMENKVRFKQHDSSLAIHFVSFSGWVLTLLSLEEATFAGDFLVSLGDAMFYFSFLLRAAFFLGVVLGLLSFPYFSRFFRAALGVLSLLSLGLGFFDFGSPLLSFFFLLPASLFGGFLSSSFGLAFFLGVNNRLKGISLALTFVLSLFLFLPLDQTLASRFLLGGSVLLSFFYQRPPLPETRNLTEKKPEWGLVSLAFFSFILNGALDCALLHDVLKQGSFSFLAASGGLLIGILLSLLFLKSDTLTPTYGLYLSFLCSAFAGLSFFFFREAFFSSLASFLLALAHVLGLFSLYYVLGVYTKKYQNMVFYKGGAAFSGLAYILGVFLGKRIPFSPDSAFLYGTLLVVLPLFVLIFTPFFFLAQGKKEWIADLSRQEVTSGDALNSFFEDWKLSKREKEVARFLLSGLTLRQIALTMSLSYATINTYQSSLYRKLGVNSRSELLLRCQAFLTPKPPH